MAPKTISATEKTKRTKRAGALLAAQMHSDSLSAQKKELKTNMKTLAKEKKKAMRIAKRLKAKAQATDMTDLMQIIVMKASMVEQETQSKSGGSSSSTDPWTPTSPKEAFDKIHDLLSDSDNAEIERFAAALRAKANSVNSSA